MNVKLEKIWKGTDVNVSMYFPSIEGDAYRGTGEIQNSFSATNIWTKYLPIETLERYRSTNLRIRNSKGWNLDQNNNSLDEREECWILVKWPR